jgi:hypothetical protein
MLIICQDCLVQVPYTPDKDMFSKDSIYEDFCVDDVDLAFENYEELFGTSHIQTEQLFDDAGIDSYFKVKELPAGDPTEVCSLLVCQLTEPISCSSQFVSLIRCLVSCDIIKIQWEGLPQN